MELTQRDIERVGVLILIVILAFLVFILIKPIILSIIGGLILAYALSPLYKIILRKIKNKNTAAALVSILTLLVIIIPLYLIAPLLIRQVFTLFELSQKLNIQNFLNSLFPTASEQFIIQLITSFNAMISKVSSTILNSLVTLLLEIPTILFHLVIVSFVFFFTLKDSEKLREFVSSLSPLNKIQELKLVKQFKDITNTIVYGQIFIGIIQGLIAGIGFFIFGIPNVIILTTLAVILSIIPIVGPFFIWVPLIFYMLLTGASKVAIILFIAYNLILVSNIDNLLRLHLVARKTNLSQVIILVGMIGGLMIFGLLGLILGPLILAYFIVFLEAYRKNELSSLYKS